MIVRPAPERTGLHTWRGAPTTLLGNAVKAGDHAPDFRLTGAEVVKRFSLSDALAGGTRAALFVVVPSIDTGTCSKETHTFDERAAELPADKIAVFTISMDLPFAQKRWCAAEGVGRITMLSDYYDHSFGYAYGVRVQDRGLLARSLFVIDKSGIVRYAKIVPDATQEPDYDEALAAARSAIS
jgi:thioredoxin-dependent peroxiredoxin